MEVRASAGLVNSPVKRVAASLLVVEATEPEVVASALIKNYRGMMALGIIWAQLCSQLDRC